ncbi:MAG: mycothione reductase [Microlunatus sp.]|nr:mycothione reductase [Microlunatus sp.]MDN5771774.1 mycothione reductase [Microlunatus sp.]
MPTSHDHVDLCLIGSGSANSIPDERFDDLSIALIEGGTFGGTCLNVGCIPTKMYVHPADLAQAPGHAAGLGVDLSLDRVRWTDIRDRIFGRIDTISAAGLRYRQQSRNLTVHSQHARFVADRRLRLDDGTEITADRFVIAAGSRVHVPDIEGLADVDFHTSDTVMRLSDLPSTMIIVGGGYVAAEFAHVFSALGTDVTLVVRGEGLLRHEDVDVAAAFTEAMGSRVDLRLRHQVERLSRSVEGGVTLAARSADGDPVTLTAEVLLLATGRLSNADTLEVQQTGVVVDDAGNVAVDAHQQTTRPGIFALGDVSSHHQLKHVANHEARVVQHNLLHPDAMITASHRHIPHAVFSDPQVAAVGLTQQTADDLGVSYVVGRCAYGAVAYGWAMGEGDWHFVKVLADPATGRLLGAHLIGPESSSLIQPLIQAMSFDLHAEEFARGQYWIHPALAEVVENAVLNLPLQHRWPGDSAPSSP